MEFSILDKYIKSAGKSWFVEGKSVLACMSTFLLQSDIVKLDLVYSTLLQVNFGVSQKERIFWNKMMFFNETSFDILYFL